MTPIARISAIAICVLNATSAWSADYKVKRSLEVPATSVEVWHLIGDFCDIDDWHPNVKACSLKVMDGSLNRVLATDAGEQIVQKRIAQEPGLSYTYKTVNTPRPIDKFTATLSVEANEKSLIEWSANFSTDDPEMEDVVVREIETGLSAIESALASR